MRNIICNAAVLIGLTACAAAPSPPPASSPTASNATLVRVVAKDFAFDSSHTVPAGLVAIRLVNEGKAMHMLGISKLDSNKTVADVFRGDNSNSAMAWFHERGGPGIVSPGDSTTSYMVLEPGTYSMICWVDDSTGKAHIMDGMMATLTVTGQNAGAPVEPTPDVYVRETDYHIAVRDSLSTGWHMFRVDNDGPQTHDLAILRVLPGKTDAAIEQWFDKPTMSDAPVEAVGGLVGEERWSHNTFRANLTPGDYLFLCMIPDATDHKPHFMHGMITHVHVS